MLLGIPGESLHMLNVATLHTGSVIDCVTALQVQPVNRLIVDQSTQSATL